MSFFTPRCPLCLHKFFSVRDKQRALLIAKKEQHIKEQQSLLDMKEKQVEKEREFLLDNKDIQKKRDIILPAMERKWQAEKAKVDQEADAILKTVKFKETFLSVRKTELEGQLTQVRKRPPSQPNHDLMVEAQSRLDEINLILRKIDETRPTSN